MAGGRKGGSIRKTDGKTRGPTMKKGTGLRESARNLSPQQGRHLPSTPGPLSQGRQKQTTGERQDSSSPVKQRGRQTQPDRPPLPNVGDRSNRPEQLGSRNPIRLPPRPDESTQSVSPVIDSFEAKRVERRKRREQRKKEEIEREKELKNKRAERKAKREVREAKRKADDKQEQINRTQRIAARKLALVKAENDRREAERIEEEKRAELEEEKTNHRGKVKEAQRAKLDDQIKKDNEFFRQTFNDRNYKELAFHEKMYKSPNRPIFKLGSKTVIKEKEPIWIQTLMRNVRFDEGALENFLRSIRMLEDTCAQGLTLQQILNAAAGDLGNKPQAPLVRVFDVEKFPSAWALDPLDAYAGNNQPSGEYYAPLNSNEIVFLAAHESILSLDLASTTLHEFTHRFLSQVFRTGSAPYVYGGSEVFDALKLPDEWTDVFKSSNTLKNRNALNEHLKELLNDIPEKEIQQLLRKIFKKGLNLIVSYPGIKFDQEVFSHYMEMYFALSQLPFESQNRDDIVFQVLGEIVPKTTEYFIKNVLPIVIERGGTVKKMAGVV